MAAEAVGWLQIAERDLKAVRNNVFGPEPTTEIAAFHCQQAAEKMFKAVLVSAGIDPPRRHNIDDLIDLLPADHPLKTELEPLGRFSPYAIAYRYPVQDPDILPEQPTRNEIVAWLEELDQARAGIAALVAPAGGG